MNANGQNTTLPSLSGAGAVFSAAVLFLLAVLSAYLPVLTPLFTVVSGAILAGMLLLHRSLLSVLVPFICAALSAILARDSTAAVLSFLFLPIGFCAAFAVFMRFSRMTAIIMTGCATAFVGTASLASCILASGISPAALFDEIKSDAVSWLTSHTVLTEGGVHSVILTDESARAIVSYITLLAPALLIGALFLLAYTATGILWKILTLLGAQDDFLPNGWYMMPSRLSAAVYLIVQPITFICAVSFRPSALYYGLYNVSLVFLLPLAVLGLSAFTRLFRQAKKYGASCRAALLILVLMTAAAGLYWLLTFAAFYGVYIVFRSRIARND